MILENTANTGGKTQARRGAATVAFPETALLEAAKQGHSKAFGALCERYTQQLLRTAHRITRSQEDAEDAVQDALMRAFVHIGDFDNRSSFATWLTRIAINSALMILRKKRTSREIAIEGGDEAGTEGRSYEIVDRAPNPEWSYAQREEQKMLTTAVLRLRPSLRRVVEFQQLQGHSMKETAESIGISVAAAKARLFHAKAALRKSPALRFARQRRPFRRLLIQPAA